MQHGMSCHVANYKGTRLQSHTFHVANKIQPFVFFANWHAMLQTDTSLFTSCDQTYFYFFQMQAHTCHVANHKGTRVQSHTCHVANKYKPLFFFANWQIQLDILFSLANAITHTKEPGLHFSSTYKIPASSVIPQHPCGLCAELSQAPSLQTYARLSHCKHIHLLIPRG
jgi:hypothetical protein